MKYQALICCKESGVNAIITSVNSWC